MDKEVVERQLNELSQKAMREARSAVEQAPDGHWIAASEWQVRDIFQRLTRDCYQAMLQAKADAHWAADQAVFSPGGGGVGGAASAEQGQTQEAGAQRRRRG